MDSSGNHILLGVDDDHSSQNISFEEGTSLGTKRLHLDSESSVDNDVILTRYLMGNKRVKMENSPEGLMQGDSCDGMGDETGAMLDTSPAEVLPSADTAFNEEGEEESSTVLVHHMDIEEPLSNVKKALEEEHDICLDGYEFYLQDAAPLAAHKTLKEQCVQGYGTVQVNLQLKIQDDGTKKISILDVLKPSDAYLLSTGKPGFTPVAPSESSPTEEPVVPEEESAKEDKDNNLIRWVVDTNFKISQQRLQIPHDPLEWDVSHVRHWLLWAVRQFNLTGIKLADWKINGKILCNLTLENFKARVPYDPSDIFWTHLELLRRCKFVAVMQNPEENSKENNDQPIEKDSLDKNIMRSKDKRREKSVHRVKVVEEPIESFGEPHLGSWNNNNNRTFSGNNGQVQLWQFLLDLLTDKNHRDCIQWLGAEGEFKLLEPERVARLWGLRKNKPSMNYEKLSRALRYYYDGDMIAKVNGKRFVYKFVCDLKQLLGYSAYELNRLVIEAEMKALHNAQDPIQHSIFGNRNPSP